MSNYNRYRAEEEQTNQTEETLDETVNSEENTESEVKTVEELEKALEEKTNAYLLALADLENYKRRANDEMQRERKYANQSLLEELIVNYDIFDKALNVQTDDKNVLNFLIGFKMIGQNFKSVLEKYGVKKIEALGKPFDPKFHHAVETDYDETKEEGIILAEMQTGYMYKDRVLRPSLVKVNKNQEESK